MDALANLLDGPRGRDAILLQVLLNQAWSVRLEDQPPLGLITVVRGETWLTPDGGEPVRLGSGAVVVVKGPYPVTIADDPTAPPQVVVRRGWRYFTPEGEDLGDSFDLGVRTWGNHPEGTTALLLACYQVRGEISQRVLDALPTHLLLPPETWNDALVPVLADEIVADAPGQQAVLDRLFDLLLVTVIRDWFNRPEANVPSWYRAHGDPVVGEALRLVHEHPAHPWTVASLAAAAGVSRSSFARSFAERIGVPPMTYLKEWRLSLAADLLLEPQNTLDAIARRVGYSDGFALSSVFKRARGVSPQAYRETVSAL